MSAYIFCPKCSTQCAKGTESCPKCEDDLSDPNLYDEYSEYFQSRSFREREGDCYDGIVDTQVLDGNRFDWKLMLLSFGAGFLLSIMDTFDDSVFFRLLIGLGVVACVIGAFRALLFVCLKDSQEPKTKKNFRNPKISEVFWWR